MTGTKVLSIISLTVRLQRIIPSEFAKQLIKLTEIVILPVDSCFDASALADMSPKCHDYSSVSIALLKSVSSVGGAVPHLKLRLL